MKINVLDGLRGYAALLIVIAHIPHVSGSVFSKYFSIITGIAKISYLGVDIFFVLSGFLITRILLKEKKENRFSFKRFYLKRSLRIFPIYYIVLLLCGILFTWNGVEYMASYLSNYYFSFYSDPHPLRHVWSLAVEEHFYIFWPALLYLFTLNTSKKIILFLIPIIIGIALFTTYTTYDVETANNLVYRATHFRILSLAIGSFFAFIEPKIRTLSTQSRLFVLVSFIGSYVVAIFAYKISWIPRTSIPPILFMIFSITSSSFFLYILQFEHKKGIIRFLFTNKLICYIGMISYGIYLYHFPILYFFGITHNQLGSELVSFNKIIVPLILIFLIPTISFYVIEKPLLKIKNKLK